MADDQPTAHEPSSGGPSADQLAAVIEAGRQEVLSRWRDCVLADPAIPEANRLPEPELLDHVPALLDMVVEHLRTLAASTPAETSQSPVFAGDAIEHGEHRAREGYGIQAAARELATLRSVLQQVCEEHGVPLIGRAGRTVHAVLDETIALGVATLARSTGEDVARERDRANEANTEKDAFLSFVSHDLRNTLGAMKGWLQIMRDPRVTPAMTERGHEVIARNVSLMQRLLDDLMDLRRAQKRKLDVRRIRLELRGLVREAIERARPGAREAGIELEGHLGDADATIDADPQRIAQVLANLLENAIKFTDSGGRVTIDLALDAARAEVEICVRDTGAGIAPSVLPTVFEAFQQADPEAGRRTGGLGLGLALVRELVLAHGGSVRADSPGVDQGATFTVRLPLAAASSAPPG